MSRISLKHKTDMKNTFSSLQEAQDKAKEVGLTREKAAKWIRETPHGRFAFYDETGGEPVKPDVETACLYVQQLLTNRQTECSF